MDCQNQNSLKPECSQNAPSKMVKTDLITRDNQIGAIFHIIILWGRPIYQHLLRDRVECKKGPSYGNFLDWCDLPTT